MRAKNLEKGIQTLVGTAHASKLYGHPLVSTLATEKKLPSYIGSGTFAAALVDLLTHDKDGQPIAGIDDEAARLVKTVSDDPVLGPALRALSNAVAKTVADLRSEIAAWFDDGMRRVSGWYRRQTQLIIFVIGAVVTVSANASTVHVVRDLWQDDALRYSVAQEAISMASTTQGPDSLQVPDAILASFPLGWEGEDPFGSADEAPGWSWCNRPASCCSNGEALLPRKSRDRAVGNPKRTGTNPSRRNLK